MSGTQDSKKPRLPFYKRSITVTLAPARVMTLSLIFLAAIVWFFFLGLIVGRGQYPEESIPEVGRMMPRSNGTDAPLRVVTVEQEDPDAVAAVSPSSPRLDTGRTAEPARQAPRAQAAQDSRPAASREAGNPASTAVAEDVFDYTYQVASFKEPKGAEALAEKLKKDTMKARVTTSRGDKALWHRVVVDFRGTPTQTDDLRARLARHKITKIMMLTKKPVKK